MACRNAAHWLVKFARGACCRSLMLALIVPLVLVIIAHRSHADVAYVCDGGRVVNVRSGELERMKRTDPCIAAYHGLEVAPPLPPPLPARNPRLAANDAGIAGPVSPVPSAVPATEAAPASRASLMAPRVERVVFSHALPGNQRVETPTMPSAPVDFRRVPIINAQPGASAIFVHTR
ncbi:MAG: hypothetical protein ACK4MF_05765 [Hyphomicrobiaceae bacterium]